MSEIKTAVLDFKSCNNILDLHERIKKTLDFPDWYGKNWDAFRDLICFDSPITFLTVKGENELPGSLKKHIEIMNEILEATKKEWTGSKSPFNYEIID